ncbi:mitochondrial intermediate peptidase [Venturia nashicola]|nr:mitochondrial intermediate peptidase [Venturia nashicola]
MFKKAVKRPEWTCSPCRIRPQQPIRSSTTAASTRDLPSRDLDFQSSPTNLTTGTRTDDRTLKRIFDAPDFWKDFSPRKDTTTGKRAGLFLNKYLTIPEGFGRYTEATLKRCEALVQKILAAQSLEEYKSLARDMDRLSDLLCRVIDMADFVRNTHPDKEFQSACTMSYMAMLEYMNTLNTTTALNDQLKRAMDIPDVVNSWTDEEKFVANILMRDFMKSAIDLPEGTRQKFVSISNEIADVGADFVDRMAPEKSFLNFDSSKLKGMDPNMARSLTRYGKVTLPTVGTPSVMALRTVENDDVRREVYMASRTASLKSVRRLEKLLDARAKLAQLSGYETYAHMALTDKMAKSPEAVNSFLQSLYVDTKPQVKQELDELLDLKRSDAHSENFPSRINAWDRDYYSARLINGMHKQVRHPDTLSSFFSLGGVFQGLSRLFNRLYGVRFVPRETELGETWNDDVRRLDVLDESNNRIAVVYCDLFSRAGKAPNPAHFTLRCSRTIFPSEIVEYGTSDHPFSSDVEAATDGMAHSLDSSTGTVNQLPTIALICDFARPKPTQSFFGKSSRKPTLLNFQEVQTLFHEMGHALHSILGRTSLQNVSGTRCATDFAELPSVLMESFAFSPKVLDLWARHWEAGDEENEGVFADREKLPHALLKERLVIDKTMAGAETEAQIVLSMLDQAYHSHSGGEGNVNSTKIYHDIYQRYSSIPEPPGTAWQGFFGHLYGYGATYYAYLFDRAIAAKVWKEVFQEGEKAVDRKMGERYKEEVLKWGGGREGWKCVAGVLRHPALADGGEEAMKEVGRWGVRNA